MGKTGNFLKGLLFGALAGATAGVLFAPKSGKETREELMKMVNKMKKEASNKLEAAQALVMEKVAAVKVAGKKLDEKKYLDIVSEVVTELKKDKEVTVDAVKKLSTQLKRDWNKVKGVLSSTEKTEK